MDKRTQRQTPRKPARPGIAADYALLAGIPDEMKVIGDKCLFDVGLIGRQVHGGHDLSALGRRSYETASELLQIFAEDRRLREFFRQNCLWNLPI